MSDFLTFRSRALQALTLLNSKDRPRFSSMEDKENWVKKEYTRHFKNGVYNCK